jgi:hypothetical protein
MESVLRPSHLTFTCCRRQGAMRRLRPHVCECRIWVDGVEKVCGTQSARNNGIMVVNFLNRSCAFEASSNLLIRSS